MAVADAPATGWERSCKVTKVGATNKTTRKTETAMTHFHGFTMTTQQGLRGLPFYGFPTLSKGTRHSQVVKTVRDA